MERMELTLNQKSEFGELKARKHAIEAAMGEFQSLGSASILAKQLALILLLTAIPLLLYYSSYNNYAGSLRRAGGNDSASASEEECDLFTGEWEPDPTAPYYSNSSCDTIHEFHCRKFGRPDDGYTKWRWRPRDCELAPFDPEEFLETMKGKSMAFVGDSLARNHFDSLVCLLSRVARPVVYAGDKFGKRTYAYAEHNFNISVIWSVYLVHSEATVNEDYSHPFNVFLDEFDLIWTARIADFDYIVVSAGRWFTRPAYLYLNRTLVGCLHCSDAAVNHFPLSFAYRRAFNTAFRAINSEGNFAGVTFLTTLSPSHYEGAPWNKGGDCTRRAPFRQEEIELDSTLKEMHSAQLEELGIAQRDGQRTGRKFRLLDITPVMALRPDGHPSHYGRLRGVANDCVHWCLPGPIDTWNNLLQELLRKEGRSKIYIEP